MNHNTCWLKSLRESAGALGEDAKELSNDIFDYESGLAADAERASLILTDVAYGIESLIVETREANDD